MSDPAILFVKPGAVKSSDKAALRKAGVVVVEIDDPVNVKFIRAGAELSANELLGLTAKVIGEYPQGLVREKFGEAVAKMLARKAAP